METLRRYSRRTFVAWVGGASAGFYLFGRVPGLSAPVALAQIRGRHARPGERDQVRHSTADPAGDAEGGHDQPARRQGRRLLRDLHAAVRAADSSCEPPEDDRLGLRRQHGTERARPARPQRSLAHDRGDVEPAGPGQVDQRARRRERELPAAPPPGRPDPALGQPARRHPCTATCAQSSTRRLVPIPVLCRSSRTCTAPWASADDSDGYAEAWYLPAASNIPSGLRNRGDVVRLLRRQGGGAYGVEWGPGFATFQYPNENRASTIWYHDHTLGMTRLNVYAGPAGFYLVRGGPAGDDEVLDTRNGRPASLPGPAPRENDKFPPNKRYREIPIAIQDRSFNSGRLALLPRHTRVLRRDRGRLPSRRASSRRSGTPSSSATRSWSTATRGRSSTVERAATGSASSTAASRAS